MHSSSAPLSRNKTTVNAVGDAKRSTHPFQCGNCNNMVAVAAPVNLSTILLTIAVLVHRREGGAHCKTYNEVKYGFRYSVNEPRSGVVMDQWESRAGEFVKGAYSMLDADGKVRTVHYEVDGRRGFHAVVRRKFPGSQLLVSHLLYPRKYRTPYQHAKPVSLITKDLFDNKVRPYPNLPDT